jgi:hypothetical protein
MSLSHGDSQSGNRPGCWGRADTFDTESRECRGCGFQITCRSQVINQTLNQQQTVPQVSTLPSYYSIQPHAQQPYAVPKQVAQAPVPFQAPPAPAPVAAVTRYVPPPAPLPTTMTAPYSAPPRTIQQQPPPQMQQMPQQHPQMTQDFYGRMQDPLFFQILGSPPFRPQMPGENFGERVVKNLLLDLGTMAFFHAGLALRQMFLPPKPPGQE